VAQVEFEVTLQGLTDRQVVEDNLDGFKQAIADSIDGVEPSQVEIAIKDGRRLRRLADLTLQITIKLSFAGTDEQAQAYITSEGALIETAVTDPGFAATFVTALQTQVPTSGVTAASFTTPIVITQAPTQAPTELALPVEEAGGGGGGGGAAAGGAVAALLLVAVAIYLYRKEQQKKNDQGKVYSEKPGQVPAQSAPATVQPVVPTTEPVEEAMEEAKEEEAKEEEKVADVVPQPMESRPTPPGLDTDVFADDDNDEDVDLEHMNVLGPPAFMSEWAADDNDSGDGDDA